MPLRTIAKKKIKYSRKDLENLMTKIGKYELHIAKKIYMMVIQMRIGTVVNSFRYDCYERRIKVLDYYYPSPYLSNKLVIERYQKQFDNIFLRLENIYETNVDTGLNAPAQKSLLWMKMIEHGYLESIISKYCRIDTATEEGLCKLFSRSICFGMDSTFI